MTIHDSSSESNVAIVCVISPNRIPMEIFNNSEPSDYLKCLINNPLFPINK